MGGQWTASRALAGGLFTSLEGSNRAPCLMRWPAQVPAGKVSNELVHLVDTFTTLLLAAGARSPTTGRSTAWTCATSCSATPSSPGATPSCAFRATGCRR